MKRAPFLIMTAAGLYVPSAARAIDLSGPRRALLNAKPQATSSPGASLSIVQKKIVDQAPVNGNTTVSMSQTPGSGNLLVMMSFSTYGSTANTYTINGSWNSIDSSNTVTDTYTWLTAYRIVSGDTTSLTPFSQGTTSGSTSIAIYELSGQAASGYINGHTVSGTSGASWTSSSLTPSVSGCFGLSLAMNYYTSFAESISYSTSGWTNNGSGTHTFSIYYSSCEAASNSTPLSTSSQTVSASASAASYTAGTFIVIAP